MAELLAEFKRMGVDMNKVTRFEAVSIPPFGALGCAMSHVGALEMSMERGWEKVLILEDDFKFASKKAVQQNLDAMRGLPHRWKVVLFSAGRVKDTVCSRDPRLLQISEAYSTAGYLVNGRVMQERLRDNFNEAVKLLAKHGTSRYEEHAIDRYWAKLQARGGWWGFSNKMGWQRASRSDIEGKVVNYGH